MNNYIALHKSCAKTALILKQNTLSSVKNDQQHFTQSCTTSENCKSAKSSQKNQTICQITSNFQVHSTHKFINSIAFIKNVW